MNADLVKKALKDDTDLLEIYDALWARVFTNISANKLDSISELVDVLLRLRKLVK